MFDIKQVLEEAEKEINDEKIKSAKSKLKESLSKISKAKQVVANLELEHQALLKQIGAEN